MNHITNYFNKIKTKHYEKKNLNFELKCNWLGLLKSIHKNYLFFVEIIFCIYFLNLYNSKKITFVNSLCSFYITIFLGWFIHLLSHTINYEKIYDSLKLPIHSIMDKFIRKFILYTFNFHDQIHHDSSVNKQFMNVIIEFIQNIITQGGLLMIINNYFHLQLDNTAILLWGLMYSTVHNINYRVTNNLQHRNHHIDPTKNYALDFIDILFNTKYDLQNIENLNFSWGNYMIIITFLIIKFNCFIK